MVEMKKYKLGDLGKIVTGKTPRTSIEENYGGDIPFITPSDDLSVKDIREVSKKITELGLKEVKNCLLPPRSICVSCIGSDMGKVVMTSVPSVTNQQFNSIIPNESFDADYIYYLMIPIGQQMKNKLGKQSTAVPIVSKSQFSDIDVSIICDIKDQKKVSSALSSIDNRIENLRAQNRVLEQTAKTIYDYTFLQCAGHQTTYNKTLNRNIPTNWEVKEFQNICNIKRGASPRPIDDYMDPTNQGMPWVKISDASKDGSPFMLDVKESIIKDGVSKSVTVTPGTLIVSNSASPGIPKFIQLTACVHDGWLVLDKYDESFKYYLFYVILDMRENLLHIASGSVFKNLKTDYLKYLPVLIPDSKTMENFNAKVKPLFKKQLVNAKQIESLTTQRNTLLPLLMTGKIEV